MSRLLALSLLALASWLDTKAEVDYITYLSGDGQRISALFFDLRADRLSDKATIQADTQHIELAADWPAAQAAFRKSQAQSMPLATNTPAWVKEAVILEVIPSYFPGGLPELAEKLPFYKEIGFNTVYLLPHWLGGYGNLDPYTLDPAFGEPEDLKALVKRAHELGMRFLFDMVIHGIHPDSPLVRSHPEYFTHNVASYGWPAPPV